MRLAARVAATATAFLCSLSCLSFASPAVAASSPELVSAAAATSAPAASVDPVSFVAPGAATPAAPPVVSILATLPKAPAMAITTATASASSSNDASSLNDLVHQQLGSNTADDEHECLAASVYFESKGQPYRGQLAVAQTIINRTKSGRFPTTVCGVVKQPHQFGFLHNGDFPSIARAGHEWREAVAIASIAMQNAWSAVVAKETLYFNTGRSPSRGLIRVAQIGAQAFYR